jgi:murein DD-endopeptidase MepM/ murein hydrolase activator NlpD
VPRTSPRRFASTTVALAAVVALLLAGPTPATASPSPSATAGPTASPTPSPTLAPPREFSSAPRPKVSGTAQVASTVTAVAGTWAPAAALTYQWRLDGAAVRGATARTYLLPASAVGKRLTVTVTAARAGYRTTSTTSASVDVAAAVLARGTVALSGAPTLGATLTAVTPGFGPTPFAVSYQWKRNGVSIVGATARTYAATAADLGRSITVRVIVRKPGYSTVGVTATPVTIGRPFTAAPTPSVSGKALVGSTVRVSSAAWAPAPVSLAYQWLRNGKAIRGATGVSYILAAADAGTKLSVRTTATKSGYTRVVRVSPAVPVPRVLTVPAKITVSGSGSVGSTLSAVPGAWGPGSVALTYRWLRDGEPISGATSRTYRLVAADAASTVSVRIKGRKSGYTTVTRTSSAVAVLFPFSTVPTPKVTGSAQAGRILTVSPGVWRPSPAKLKMQWRVDGSPISGATGATWEVPAWAAGRSITVSVTATKKDHRPATATSSARTVSWSLGSTIVPGTSLRPGVQVTSPDGRYAFGILGDGNVALTKGHDLVRTSRTTGALDGTLVFTGDGELLLLDDTDTSLWSSRSAGLGGTALRLGNDGVLRLLNGEGEAVWSSERMPAAAADATAATGSVPGRYGWAYPLRPNGSFTTYAGHSGDDIAAPTGTPVYAMRGGTVSLREVWITSGCPSWAPNRTKQKEVVLTSTVDGTSLVQVYAHLSAFSVKTGQTVAAGQRIGSVGSTGCSTGPHLHTAFTVDGVRYALFPRDVLGTATY